MFNGPALRIAREAKGLGVEELAEMAGVTRQSVWSYESGQAEPKTSTGLRLCGALGIDLGSLYVHETHAASSAGVGGEVAA